MEYMDEEIRAKAGEGAAGFGAEEPVEAVDTDADSWDSGMNLPDVVDAEEYEEVQPVGEVEDEGDEDNLGNEEDGEPDPDAVEFDPGDVEPLDDEEIDDRTFDCD